MKEVEYFITRERVLPTQKNNNMFYYELRHYDNDDRKYVIESERVIVNFYGTLITNKEILNYREFIDAKDFFKENIVEENELLNPFEGVN